MAFTQVDKSVAITFFTKGIYGYRPLTIDEYDTDNEPQIKAGFVEVGGEIYENYGALSITGWSGISNSTQAYIYIVPGGSTATAIFSATAPTWSNVKQGWYNGSDRALWAVYKDSAGTGYTNKAQLSYSNILKVFGSLFLTGYIEAQGYSVTTAGDVVSTLTPATGSSTEYGSDFVITHPTAVYGKFSGMTTSGVMQMHIQGKYDSGYSDISFDRWASDYIFHIAETAIGYNHSTYRMLLPGTYRLAFTKDGYTGSLSGSIYKYGNFGGGDSV